MSYGTEMSRESIVQVSHVLFIRLHEILPLHTDNIIRLPIITGSFRRRSPEAGYLRSCIIKLCNYAVLNINENIASYLSGVYVGHFFSWWNNE
jgi:hypothetical protein